MYRFYVLFYFICTLPSFAVCQSPASMLLKLNFEMQSDNELEEYEYFYEFSSYKENSQYFICIKKTNSKEGTIDYFKSSLSELALMTKRDRTILSSPISIFGKQPGVLFLERKINDSPNFLGLSFPRKVGRLRSEWGWLPLVIRSDNNFYTNYYSEKFFRIRRIKVDEDQIYYKSFGKYSKIPLGLKSLVFEKTSTFI